jgi:hypothetical protein
MVFAWRILWLAVMAVGLTRPAHAQWLEARSQRFIVYSNGSEAGLRSAVARLETFDQLLRIYTPVQDDPEEPPLTIWIMPNNSAVRALSQKPDRGTIGFYEAGMRRTIAVVSRRSSGTGEFAADMENILFHEYTHHFLLRHIPVAYPLWLTEGLAEYFGATEIHGGNKVLVGRVPGSRGLWLTTQRWIPMEELLNDKANLSRDEGSMMMYAQGWLISHYFLSTPERVKQLAIYVLAINQGMAPAEALKLATGLDFIGFNGVLLGYVNKAIQGRTLTVPADPDAKPVAVRSLAEAESAALLARLSLDARAETNRLAKTVTELSQWAQRAPNEPMVRLALAEAHYWKRDFKAAEAEVDAALARKPNLADALILKGWLQLEQSGLGNIGLADISLWEGGSASSAARPELLQDARRWFVKANRADPQSAHALMMYAMTFQMPATQLPADAVAALDAALYLAPQVAVIRLARGAVALARKERATAINALAPMAYAPHLDGATRLKALDLLNEARALPVPLKASTSAPPQPTK